MEQIAAFSSGLWVKKHVLIRLGPISPDQRNDEDTDFCCRLVAAQCRCWFERAPGSIVYRGYETGDHIAPQLTRVYDRTVASQCYARTFTRNEAAFKNDRAGRWFLLFRALRACARNQTDDVAIELLAMLPIGAFKARGYVYWRIKKLGKRLGFR